MSHGHCGPALSGRCPAVTLATLKSEMRADILARRSTVDDIDRERLTMRLAALGPGLVTRHTPASRAIVSAFLPIRGEPDCLPLMHALMAAGIDTALPVTPKRGLPLRFHTWCPGEPLAIRTWGIAEPVDAPEVDPDVLFVPLAAFDRRGHRLGYGAGFYDNALAILRARKPVLAIGVGFALQEVEAVPAEPHDERLDMIVTEQATHIVTDR